MTLLPLVPADPARRAAAHAAERSARAERTDELTTELRGCVDPAEGERLRHQLALANLGVARAVASRYAHRGVAGDDLRQVAYLALLRAALRFDPEAGHDFLSYGVPTVRGEIQRYFRDQEWTIRLPRRIQEVRRRVHDCADDLGAQHGRSATISEIAQQLGLDTSEVATALAADTERPLSLEHPVGTDGAAVLGDLIGEEDRGQASAEARAVLAPALRALGERDRRILLLRFFHGLTQLEIAADVGVTQMQVSRILGRIFRDLRRMIDPEESGEPMAG